MTALASLPTLAVSIAFNPTNLQSLTQTWTDVTTYVRDFTTSSGRQHFLDRIESSTIRLTLDNRTGYFLNGTTNGTGSVIRTRLPIKVTATTGGTTYPVFWGLTESAEDRTADELNQDIVLSATDNTKYLSLLYMNRPSFWSQYAKSASAVNWYRCDGTQALPDLIGTRPGQVIGVVSNTTGALLYDTDTAIDLTNGNNATNIAYLTSTLAGSSGSSTAFSIDFWVLGSTLSSDSLLVTGTGTQTYTINIDPLGRVVATVPGGLQYTSPVLINDGDWHHIGLYSTAVTGGNYPYYLWVDGVSYFIGNVAAANVGWINFNLGSIAGTQTSCYVDEIVISGATATMAAEVAQRYAAGSLLSNVIASGDRIAEVLVLAGYGSIVSGALVVPNYTVNDVTWSANSGAFFVQNLQSPVTSSTALDLIQQVTDTDVGAFFQKPDGSFEFDDQAYLYTATNNATPTGANVWSDTAGGSVTTFYEPTTLQVLRDDADLWTIVKVTAQNGTVQTYENTTNEPLYAYSTLTKSNVVSVTNEQALQEAIYLGNLYQSPLPRVGNVELRSQTNNGANLVEMLSPYLNDQVRFIRSAPGASAAGSIDSAVVIESIRHDFQADPGYWHTSFTLDPFPKRGQNSTPKTFFLLFDDSTYGKFDTTNEYL